jgi:SAM-dependent methyltransferase
MKAEREALGAAHSHPAGVQGFTTSTAEQSAQDDEYWFPYHYVAQFRGQFRQCFLDTWSINYVSTIEYLLGRIAAERPRRIVDIGCGDGRFTRELSLTYPDCQVVGIDYSARATVLARAMNPDRPNLEFHALDITQPLDLGTFDLAILMEVFEHIPLAETASFMAGVRRLMQPGGVLYVTVPHENKPLEYKHFQHFSAASLVRQLQPCFEVVEVVPFEKRALSRKLLTRVLSNRFFVLNNDRLLNRIYAWYKKHLFLCESERVCQRLFVRAVAR